MKNIHRYTQKKTRISFYCHYKTYDICIFYHQFRLDFLEKESTFGISTATFSRMKINKKQISYIDDGPLKEG